MSDCQQILKAYNIYNIIELQNPLQVCGKGNRYYVTMLSFFEKSRTFMEKHAIYPKTLPTFASFILGIVYSPVSYNPKPLLLVHCGMYG